MNGPAPVEPARREETAAISVFAPPLVSVVIVNYNYGAFLPDAVGSVFRQTYREVECIVLDNASTDDSLAVLADLAKRYPRLRVARRDANDGQCVASAEGFASTGGDYVVFLDADDVLLPEFVAVHVFVHLSSRIPVGFTCSDMFQSHGPHLVLGAFVAINDFVRSSAGRLPELLRPVAGAPGNALADLVPIDATLVHYCGPDRADWAWASTSAFMFRRDALTLLLRNPDLCKLSCALDVYLARGLNVLFGSLVIDRPMAVYRMHKSNIYARHAQLANWFNFERGGGNDQERLARKLLVDNMVASAEFFLSRLQNRERFVKAIANLCSVEPRLRTDDGKPYVDVVLARLVPLLRRHIGAGGVLLWTLKLRLLSLAIIRALIGAKAD